MLSISFLDKLPYKGSYNGKRFMFDKCVESDKNCILRVYVWKDIYSFENTIKSDMDIKDFEYSKTGIEQGIDFVESSIVD